MGMLKLFELASRMDKVGVTVTRVGLIVVLLWIGGLKAFRYEADGIVPLVANSPIMSDEIQPYVVYRIEDDQMECALWRFKDGQKALALFLSGDAATSFKESASLGAEWKIFCPAKEALLQMLKGCHDAGIASAVLDPDFEKAKRIFNIPDILNAAGEAVN